MIFGFMRDTNTDACTVLMKVLVANDTLDASWKGLHLLNYVAIISSIFQHLTANGRAYVLPSRD